MNRTIAGVVATMLPADAGGPDADTVAGVLQRFLGHLPATQSAGLRTALLALDGASSARYGQRLDRLDADRRERLLATIARTNAGSDLLDALKASVCLVAGAEMHVDEIRARATRFDPARRDPVLDVTDSADWPSTSHADVVVVGSGAGGAMVARTLARAGADVVVVEEGRRWSVEEFRDGHPADRFGRLYRDAGATLAIGRPVVALPLGRGVGGTTLVNSGTCYRTPDAVLHHWRDDEGLDVADPARFAPWLDEVEATLQVAPASMDVIGENAERTLDAAAALGWQAAPLRRNAPGCAGSCQCAIGCPMNAKFGVHLNALPQACAAGARIVTHVRVGRIDVENGRATGITGRRPDGSTMTITADRVVVACGATETPPLLRRSGVGEHPEVGRNLALHPALSGAGRFEEPVYPWRGVLQSAGVEHFHRAESILIESTATPPGMGSMALPGYGRELARHMAGAHHLVTLGAMIGDKPGGRVHGKRDGTTLVSYRLDRDDGRKLLRALHLMGGMLLAAGATEFHTGIRGREIVRSHEELTDAVTSADIRHMHLAAFHPTGTVRMGADPVRSPVDERGALRGVDGVWVADASVVPTCPEVNPQLTIMALALAIADGLTTG